MSVKEMKEVVVPGTLIECYNTGKMIRETREAGKNLINEVAVIGLKARSEFRNSKGINILGPKHFGFNFDYVPIEKLMK